MAIKKFTAYILIFAFALAAAGLPVSAANVEEKPGFQLQTILIDNWGNNWRTEGWGGQNLTPNMSWTTLTIRDYYENGLLNFEVRNTGDGDKNFNIGLRSKRHGVDDTINWPSLTAAPEWESFSLSKSRCRRESEQ